MRPALYNCIRNFFLGVSMKYENGYVNSFVKLIQCPTVTNSGHEYFNAFHKVLDEEFPHVTATCQKIQVGGDALLYKWKGKSSDKPLVLMAHQDVVPVVESDWHYPPYGGQIVDGKVYGRGAMDCKNTLFSTIPVSYTHLTLPTN